MNLALWLLATILFVWFVVWAVRDESLRHEQDRPAPSRDDEWPYDVGRPGAL